MLHPEDGRPSIMDEVSSFFMNHKTIHPLEDIDGYCTIIDCCRCKKIGFDKLKIMTKDQEKIIISRIAEEYYAHALWQEQEPPLFSTFPGQEVAVVVEFVPKGFQRWRGFLEKFSFDINIHWLSTLYKKPYPVTIHMFRQAFTLMALVRKQINLTANWERGLVYLIPVLLPKRIKRFPCWLTVFRMCWRLLVKQADGKLIVRALQFDILGFSLGAAADRHFANRIQSEDPAIISAIRQAMTDTTFNGSPAGKPASSAFSIPLPPLARRLTV
ncbi:hypothetical protein BEE12_22605 (plasmid) [Pantoea agglomerans]|nr:hypothetical protein BEE12_22605 [Pantoea agglomerans]